MLEERESTVADIELLIEQAIREDNGSALQALKAVRHYVLQDRAKGQEIQRMPDAVVVEDISAAPIIPSLQSAEGQPQQGTAEENDTVSIAEPGGRLELIAMYIGAICVVIPMNILVIPCILLSGASLMRSGWRKGWWSIAFVLIGIALASCGKSLF